MATTARARVFIEYAGAQVRRQRLRLGLTQEQLAEKCDYTPRYVQRIEAGVVDMPISTAVHLSDVLGIAFPAGLFRETQLQKAKLGRPSKKALKGA